METIIILGIIAVLFILYVTNVEMTIACSSDGTPMKKLELNHYQCPKCGKEKQI